MAKFMFKLQPMLNVKKQIEDSLKNELGKSIRRLEYEKNVLVGFENEQEACYGQMTSKSGNGVAVKHLREYSAYISILRDRILVQKENINNAQKNVDNYREQLVKALQEKEMLEKLREKKYQEYLNDHMKQEQSITDEIVSYNYSKAES